MNAFDRSDSFIPPCFKHLLMAYLLYLFLYHMCFLRTLKLLDNQSMMLDTQGLKLLDTQGLKLLDTYGLNSLDPNLEGLKLLRHYGLK